METSIKQLVSMNDTASLLELMNDSQDEFLQLDAAEGLVTLGDKRGLEFLSVARESDDKEIREYAEEILDSSEIKQMQEQIAAEQVKKHQARLLEAGKRLTDGKKVFRYKVVPLSASDLVDGNDPGNEYNIPPLEDAGLEGWEVVNFIPPSGGLPVEGRAFFIGAYVLLKKEITPKDRNELE